MSSSRQSTIDSSHYPHALSIKWCPGRWVWAALHPHERRETRRGREYCACCVLKHSACCVHRQGQTTRREGERGREVEGGQGSQEGNELIEILTRIRQIFASEKFLLVGTYSEHNHWKWSKCFICVSYV